MNLLVLITLICGTLYLTETANTYDGYGNIMQQRNGNKGTLNPGFSGNLERRNSWLLPTRRPTINSGFNFGLNGNYATSSLWSRPTNLRPTYPAVTASNDEIDPEVAKQFPELVNLLDRLKEQNKLKEEGKLPVGNNKPNNGQTDKPKTEDTNHNNNGTTEIPNNNGDDKDDKPGDTGNTVIVISDGKVYFQAQPVVPENERKKMNETYYYVKS